MKRRSEGGGKPSGHEGGSAARSPRGAARPPNEGLDASERTTIDGARRAAPSRAGQGPPAPRPSQRGSADDEQSRGRTESGLRDAHTVRVGRPDLEPRTLRSSSSTQVPPTAQRYRDDGEIAGGGMGSIRRVFDRVILREVARKTLHPSAAAIPGAAALLLEEAQITGQLDHPNIVPVYDVQADGAGGAAHFTLKLVRGETLKVLAKGAMAGKPEPARLERLLKVFVKVCDAVAFAHDRGVIHRDLKPDNVMVGTHGQVYVMDWGIAMLRGGRPSAGAALRTTGRAQAHKTGAAIGTPGYMAPEQAWGGQIDERTDVFGLGAILYRILTDRSPWASRGGKDAIELAKEGFVTPPELRAPGRSLPPELCRIAMKAMAKDPNERYASADALKEDIEEVLRGGGWFSAKSFRAGEAIVRQGDAAGAAYIITDGHCRAIRTSGGKKVLLRRMGPGEVFGEMAIFTSQPRAATVVAETPVTVLVITPEAMEQAFGKSSWVRAFVSALAWRFLDADAKLRERS